MLAMITNSVPPYAYDVPRALGLPFGAVYRFRYHKKWIDQACDVRALGGEDAVIVLRDFERARFFPIRHASISRVMVLGEIRYIEFIVQNYGAPDHREVILREIADALAVRNAANSPKQELCPLVVRIGASARAPQKRLAGEEESNLWDKIATEIGALEVFRDYSFFRALAISDSRGKSVPTIAAEVSGKQAFRLRPSTLYFLDVLQKVPFELEKTERITKPFVVQISSPEPQIAIVRGVEKVVGKYDLLRFAFRTVSTEGKAHAELQLETKEGQSVDAGAPFLRLSVTIIPSWRRWLVRGAQIAAAVTGGVAMVYATRWSEAWGVPADWFRVAGVLLLAFAVQGWKELLKRWVEKEVASTPSVAQGDQSPSLHT